MSDVIYAASAFWSGLWLGVLGSTIAWAVLQYYLAEYCWRLALRAEARARRWKELARYQRTLLGRGGRDGT